MVVVLFCGCGAPLRSDNKSGLCRKCYRKSPTFLAHRRETRKTYRIDTARETKRKAVWYEANREAIKARRNADPAKVEARRQAWRDRYAARAKREREKAARWLAERAAQTLPVVAGQVCETARKNGGEWFITRHTVSGRFGLHRAGSPFPAGVRGLASVAFVASANLSLIHICLSESERARLDSVARARAEADRLWKGAKDKAREVLLQTAWRTVATAWQEGAIRG